MSGTLWSKFFWSDWRADPALRVCSYAARGLWMEMLCIAGAHDPVGYVAVSGRGLEPATIARMTGGEEAEVAELLGELNRAGVYSVDRHGRMYSRRMISDAKKAEIARKNGKNGGNPSLGKDKGNSTSVNPPDKGGVKGGVNTQWQVASGTVNQESLNPIQEEEQDSQERAQGRALAVIDGGKP